MSDLINNHTDNCYYNIYKDMIDEYTPKYYKCFEVDLVGLVLNKQPLPELFYKNVNIIKYIFRIGNSTKPILYTIGVILLYFREKEYNLVKSACLLQRLIAYDNRAIDFINDHSYYSSLNEINKKYNDLIEYYDKELNNYLLNKNKGI